MYTIEQMEKLIEESRKELNKLNEEMGFIHDEMYGFNKYHHSKIYKIVSDNTDKIYIGSTTKKLKDRLKNHELCYKSFLNKKFNNITSFIILEYGIYRIELIENVCVSNKKELEQIEGKYIKKTLNVVNKCIPGRTKKEHRDDNLLKIKEYDRNRPNKEERKIKKSEKHYCDCGIEYTHVHKSRHFKTQRHINFIKNPQP